MVDINPAPGVSGEKIRAAPNPTPPSADAEFGKFLLETDALAKYVARHGDVLQTADKDEAAYAKRVVIYESFLTAHGAAIAAPDAAHWEALMKAYAKLTAITYGSRGVNGRTILDTQAKSSTWSPRRLFDPRYRPLAIGVILFAIALMLELLTGWAGQISDPAKQLTSGLQKFGYAVVDSLSSFLIPAAWGGIGGCIFLTKRLSDKLFEMAYEEARVKGDATRIFLGAMLGVIVVVLFFPKFGEQIQVGEVNLGPATAAFLAGLGVKPVYTAFETLSEGLSKWIAGQKEAKGGGQ